VTPEIDIDLFSGPGGWKEGARHLDIHPWGFEWGDAQCATARAAGHLHVVQGDIAEMDPRTMLLGARVRGMIASPPCQGFTEAGLKKGKRDMVLLFSSIAHLTPATIEKRIASLRESMEDTRSILVLEPLRWAMFTNPSWLAWEQVPGVLPLWEEMAKVLRKAGYSVATGIVNAEQFGVPQARRRAVLVARSDGKEARLPEPTHSLYHRRSPKRLDEGVQPWTSMGEAVGNLPAAVPGDTDWIWKRPAPTIVGTFRPEIVAKPVYRKAGDGPRQNTPGSVQITLEQAAILQTFPADYPWQGSDAEKWQQVGDAVPPALAYAILKEITS